MDILNIISKLQDERREKNIVPDHVEFAHLMNEVSKETRSELNKLYSDGKIGIFKTLNDTDVVIK